MDISTADANTIEFIVTFIIGILTKHGYGKWIAKVHQARVIIDTLDNAVTNANVTDAQFSTMWSQAKNLVGLKT